MPIRLSPSDVCVDEKPVLPISVEASAPTTKSYLFYWLYSVGTPRAKLTPCVPATTSAPELASKEIPPRSTFKSFVYRPSVDACSAWYASESVKVGMIELYAVRSTKHLRNISSLACSFARSTAIRATPRAPYSAIASIFASVD